MRTASDDLTRTLREALNAKRDDAKTAWQKFEGEKKRLAADGIDLKADTDKLRALSDLHETYKGVASDAAELEERLLRHIDGKAPGGIPTGEDGRLTGLGSEFLKRVGGASGLKALDGTTGGSAVPAFFDPKIRDLPQRQLFVRSLIPVRQADSSLVTYLRQTVSTNNAAPVAAGAEKPRSTFTIERIEERVRVIAHVSEAVDRSLLSDFAALVDFLDNQLRLGVLLSEEAEVLNGDGTGERFTGIFNTTGISSVARNTAGGESRTDALYRAITAVRQAFYEPDAIVLNPADYMDVRLQKNADGDYQTGDPTAEDTPKLFGKRVITSPAVEVGTGLVGAFSVGATIWDREQARVTFTEAGLGDAAGQELFTRNLLRFRGEERLAFGVERPQAFAEVSGL